IDLILHPGSLAGAARPLLYPSLFRRGTQRWQALDPPIALPHLVLGDALLEGGFLLGEADLLGELTTRQLLLPTIKELPPVSGRPIPLRHQRPVHRPSRRVRHRSVTPTAIRGPNRRRRFDLHASRRRTRTSRDHHHQTQNHPSHNSALRTLIATE